MYDTAKNRRAKTFVSYQVSERIFTVLQLYEPYVSHSSMWKVTFECFHVKLPGVVNVRGTKAPTVY